MQETNQNFDQLEILGNCTYQEIKLISMFLGAPERSGFVNGESSGVIVSLHKKGIVEKIIRVGRTWKWRLADRFCGINERNFINERSSLNL